MSTLGGEVTLYIENINLPDNAFNTFLFGKLFKIK